MSELTNRLLKESRDKLLDLSFRNKLLNYNLNQKNRVTIVDELPNVLYKSLLEGKILKFDPVPYPEVEEDSESNEDIDEQSGFVSAKIHARRIGICTDEEAPISDENSDTVLDNHIDDAIQTLHYPDKLETLLRKFKAESNSAILETGSNLLYLGIGFLEWKESLSSEKVLHSPLILIPVQIEKGNADPRTGVYSYNLKYTDEDLFSNMSLQFRIKRDFNIDIPNYNEDEKPEEYFKKINEICENKPELIGVSRRFALDFFHFSKLLMYLDLDPSNWPDNKKITEHKILNELSGQSTVTGTRSPIGETPPEETEKLELVMDADGSQRDAITKVLQGQNLIIEGPPGTGKSQTISNLIAIALSEGKSVLFVAEKLVALEVVKKRLDGVGLGDFILELHSHKSNKSNFYASLKDRINLEKRYPNDSLKSSINELENIKTRVNEYLKVLHAPQKNIEKSAYLIFGEVQNRAKEIYHDLEPNEELIKIPYYTLERIVTELRALEKYIETDKDILKSPWNGFYATKAVTLDSDKITDLFVKYQNTLKKLIDSFDSKYHNYLFRDHETLKSLKTLNDKRVFDNYPKKEDLKLISKFKSKKLKKILAEIEVIVDKFYTNNNIDYEMVENIDELKTYIKDLKGYKDIGFFGKLFNSEYKSLRRKFNQLYTTSYKNCPQVMINQLTDTKVFLEDFTSELKSLFNMGVDKLYKSMYSIDCDLDNISGYVNLIENTKSILNLKESIEWRIEIEKQDLNDVIIECFLTDENKKCAQALKELVSNTQVNLDKLEKITNEIKSFGELNLDIFFDNLTCFMKQEIILSQKLGCSLENWIDVSRIISSLEKDNILPIINYATNKNLENELVNLTLYAYYRQWAHEVLRNNDILARFDGRIFETYLSKFRDIDAKLGSMHAKEQALKLSQNVAPQGKGGRVSEHTEMTHLRHQVNLQRNHKPIRETIKKAPNALRALKPCFMMSPLSVSQFIETSQEPFDLMIMDEASQIFPEDSLGAIARAKQIVIVGDPNQLPPSKFFSSSSSNDEDEEETTATSAESILDLALRVYPNVKRLKWHYRSQHESLISFSNHHFYNNELMLFPSPSNDKSKIGITRKFIQNGYFRAQQNTNEAVAIIDDTIKFLESNNTDSLGIVAMSKKQAELIERLLEEKTKESLNIRRLVDDANKEQRLFIKNLENVQGDEADVLFIGTTYGPDPETNRVYQRFGPINGEQGWRRINVLITRSKKRIVVFTSMKSNDIGHSEGNKGRTALKNYLRYIESGHVENIDGTTTGREPDSPFEESVIKYIQSIGFEAKPQIGVAGFFIDIGVKVENSYNYILGIECDGATYHSSRSARDRDRIRQSILESMGWDIYRIWSTDWFKHRKTEEEKLKAKLLQIKHRAIIIENDEDELEEIVIEVEPTTIVIEEDIDKIEPEETTESKPVYLNDDEISKNIVKDLKELREQKIEPRYTINSSCILSDRMIDLLSRTKPTSIPEFQLEIPLYLREKIDRNQMEFIDDIFEVIENNV